MRISDYLSVSLMILAFLPLSPAYAWSADVPDKAPIREARPVQGRDLIDLPEKNIAGSSQILLVRNTNAALTNVQIFVLERNNDHWVSPFGPLNGVIGRHGFAPPGGKREGDGRTPSGIFPLGMVFGYKPSFPTKMPYRQATADDVWVDEVQSDDYNHWVTKGTTKATSFEKMKRDDNLYKVGVVVEYNTNPVIKGYGSAIFFHLWRGQGIPTAGCIALPEEDIIRVAQWLDPAAKPLVVMGTDATVGGY